MAKVDTYHWYSAGETDGGQLGFILPHCRDVPGSLLCSRSGNRQTNASVVQSVENCAHNLSGDWREREIERGRDVDNPAGTVQKKPRRREMLATEKNLWLATGRED